MGFASGGKGVRSDINVTPLIDVVLVLLIVFMVLVPKLLNQSPVDVPPKAPDNADTPPPASDQLVVTVAEDSRIAINGEAIPLDGLAEKVRNLLQNRSKKLMFFNPDDNAPYGDVVKVMDICRGAGLKTIGIMTK
ncbi:MAG: biopolymer transporter ExbD [Deltaproteobacteria bacterium]|jgi:biopolymer transport protein ExbD|nr:biopolymer transporter ExbD [Deltaproteobacteria bacterium]